MSRGVLVTGASRGIGAAIARGFAQAGDRVAVHCGTSLAQAQAVVASLAGDGHGVVSADLADADAVEAMVAEALALLGDIDVLVNNAAVFIDQPIASVDFAHWRSTWADTLAVNLVGTANVTFCVAQSMIARGSGRIVNVSSRGAFRGEPDAPAYGAEQGGAQRARPVARDSPCAARDLGGDGSARLRRDADGGTVAGHPGR